jgi:hypothetical protein
LITDHISDTTGAHEASAISFVNTTAALPNTPTDVQAAIEAIVDRVDQDIADILADYAATTGAGLVGFDNTLSALTPLAGQGASVNTVQEAIDALKDYVDNASGTAAAFDNTDAVIVHIDGTSPVITTQDAIDGLDKVLDALVVEVNAIEASLGGAVGTDGTWVGFTGTNEVDAATSITNAIVLLDTALQSHLDDTTGAHAAAAIAFDPAGTNYDPGTITVQQALAEIDADLALHIGETVEAHMASAVGYTKAGWTAIADVKEALDDLQDRLTTTEAAAHQHYYHEEVATAAQTVVTLSPAYTTGNNSLKVFVNGQLQLAGALNAYVETNTTTITFNTGLTVGDVIQTEWFN